MIHRDAELDLPGFLEAVDARADANLRRAALPVATERLLPTRRPGATPLAEPLALSYLCVRALGGVANDAVVAATAGLLLFRRGLGVIDDVQDDEPEPGLGGWLGVNAGMALMLAGIDALWSASAMAPELREIVWRHAMRSARGQHADLAGRGSHASIDEAAAIAVEKSAFTALQLECAGALAGAGPAARTSLAAVGDDLALIQQSIDDLADVFETDRGTDLRNGTQSVAVVAARDGIADAASAGLSPVDALVRGGGLLALAQRLAAARARIYAGLQAAGCRGAWAAMLVGWVDDLLATLCHLPAIAGPLDLATCDPSCLPHADRRLFDRLRDAATMSRRRHAVARGAAPSMVSP